MKFLTKINDKNELEHSPYIRHGLSKLKKQTQVIVTVEKQHNKRSLNQNSYYWLCLDYIATHTGYSSEELHRLFKGMFLPRKEVTLNDKKYYLSGSTADLTKGQFVEYMMHISAEAAQLGIILPSTEEFKRGLDQVFLKTDEGDLALDN